MVHTQKMPAIIVKCLTLNIQELKGDLDQWETTTYWGGRSTHGFILCFISNPSVVLWCLKSFEKLIKPLSLFRLCISLILGLHEWCSGKELACQCRRLRFNPWARKIPWRRIWQPTPVFLPWESHCQRSLEGYSPCSCKDTDTTEWLNMHSLVLLEITKLYQTYIFVHPLISTSNPNT